ncbi:MAG: LPS export ABC transporter ATP-binding protein [Arenicellaceae bacterium]|mgnify:FL=1|jgi:lipopolysaccharide export system ATP-binding protein|nr:LPS export ABC transporter ATP-binding protein [Arenicellaceae bacterium]
MSILETRGLTKSYRGLRVVDKVDVSVENGEVVGLLGPNGAGKTTTFYMMVGLVRRDGGRILMDGHEIGHLPMHERARLGIGYLPQEASVFRKLTVEQNLMAVLEAQPELTQLERRRRVERLLEEFSIAHKRDSLGISLSGGERRRVEIARALALQPYFILLDEPFAGIDPISVGDIQQIIDYLRNSGIGILITDHNVRETLDICDRAYILSDGKVLAEGTAEEVLSHKGVREVYLGSNFRL